MFYIDPKTNEVKQASDQAAANRLGNGGVFIDSEQALLDAKGIPTSTLVVLYNARSDKPVTKFESRTAAAKRLWPLLMADKPAGAAATPAEEAEAEKKAKPADGAKAKGGRKPGSGKYAGKTVFAKKDANPRRVGTKGFASYEVIRGKPEGVPYEDYIASGGRPNDLAWDIERNWAEVR